MASCCINIEKFLQKKEAAAAASNAPSKTAAKSAAAKKEEKKPPANDVSDDDDWSDHRKKKGGKGNARPTKNYNQRHQGLPTKPPKKEKATRKQGEKSGENMPVVDGDAENVDGKNDGVVENVEPVATTSGSVRIEELEVGGNEKEKRTGSSKNGKPDGVFFPDIIRLVIDKCAGFFLL